MMVMMRLNLFSREAMIDGDKSDENFYDYDLYCDTYDGSSDKNDCNERMMRIIL